MNFRIVVSDLHLGKGKFRRDGSINPYEDFVDEDLFCELLQYFSKEKYEGVEGEIVFNGDTFNFVQTAVEENPDKIEITEEDLLSAAHETIEGHPKFFEAINLFLSRRNTGKVVFIAGNHDQGILHPEVQKMIAEKIEGNVLFLPLSYDIGEVHIEHGHNMEFIHQYDPSDMWYRKDGTRYLKMPWGSHFIIQIIVPLKDKLPAVDKIKPFGTFIKWGLFFKTGFTLKALLKMLWFYIYNRFFHPHKDHREMFKLDIPSIIDGATHRNVRKYVSAIGKRGFKTVIMGHTHIPMQTYIDGVYYINTGTWINMESVTLGSFGMKWKKTFVLDETIDGIRRISLKIWRGSRREKEEIFSL
jgi:UDP-2,3-diacylglucosamine pyrophosphatase LpxH